MNILRKTYFNLPLTRFINSISSNTETHYDIIITGSGMVGMTLACTLGKNTKLSKRRILLLEANKEFCWKPTEEYSNRVVALNPNTHTLLQKIDAWKHIEAVRYGPVHKLQVWDALSNSMISFNNDQFSEKVAYIVENNLLLHAVNTEIRLLSNVNISNGAKLKQCILPTSANDNVKIELESGVTYTCDLLLGCDGINSKVREAMGVHYLSWDYKQTALVATLKLSDDTEENLIAWQRFFPTGNIALLPLSTKLASLVWADTPENIKKLINMPSDQFIDELNTTLWKEHKKSEIVQAVTKVLDNILKVFDSPPNSMRQLPPNICQIEENSRAAFPLGFGHASNYVRRGVALVGDAAHRVHPLGGQGVNLGFGDVCCLNDILSDNVYSGRKLGNLIDLKKYEMQRQRHNIPTMLALDGLQKIYKTDFTPLVLLRSLGLQITNALVPVKRAIIHQAAY